MDGHVEHSDSSEALLERAARLRALAAHLVRDPSTADDLVQDTLIAGLRRGAPPADSWLSRVVRNFARRSKRSRVRREDRESSAALAEHAPTPLEVAERLETQRTVLAALSDLEEPLRTTLVLRYFEDRTSVDIARLCGVPAGTVRWRLKRGLEELRAKLDRSFDGSRAVWIAMLEPIARPHWSALQAASAGTLAVSAATQGALAMGVAAKFAGAVALVAVVGVAWWRLDASSDAAMPTTVAVDSATKSTAPQIAAPSPAVERAPQSTDERAAPPVAPAAPEAKPEAVAAITAPKTTHSIVDARFVDASGIPYSGVELSGHDDVRGEIHESSGPDGRVALEFDAVYFNGEPRHFDFLARRKGSQTVKLGTTLAIGEHGHLGEVVLAPGVSLFGRVVDDTGRGIEGARVGVGVLDTPSAGSNGIERDENYRRRWGGDGFERGPSATTKRDGQFAIEGVAKGTWRVWAKGDKTRYNWTEPIEVRGDADVYVADLALSPYLAIDRIAGRVIDPQGLGVAKANLMLYYNVGFESGTTTHTVDDDGRFDFVIQRDGDQTLVASDPQNRWSESAVEKIAPGSLDLVIQLGERKFSEITVETSEHKPIEGAELSLARRDPSVDCLAAATVLAPGRYKVPLPGYEFRVSVSAKGFRAKRELGPYTASSMPATYTVVLDPLPVVRGTVTAEGHPVADAKVSLRREEQGWTTKNGYDCVIDSYGYDEVSTDAAGHFEIGCSSLSPFVAVVEAKDWADAWSGPHSPPKNSLEINFELTHGGTIEGRVVRADGKSAEGTIVGINHGDGKARTLRAGADGRYRATGLAEGHWQVLVRNEEVRPDSTTISNNNEPHQITWTCDVVAGRTTYYDLEAK